MPAVLKTALESLTVPKLKDLASYLPGETPQRKQELIDKINSDMQSDGARAVWNQLDELQRAAVIETLQEGRFDQRRFIARYGVKPSFIVDGKKSSNHYDKKSSALGLFILYDPHERNYQIPADL